MTILRGTLCVCLRLLLYIVFKENRAKLFVILANPDRASATEKTCICGQVVSQEQEAVKGCRPGQTQNNLTEFSKAGIVSISNWESRGFSLGTGKQRKF